MLTNLGKQILTRKLEEIAAKFGLFIEIEFSKEQPPAWETSRTQPPACSSPEPIENPVYIDRISTIGVDPNAAGESFGSRSCKMYSHLRSNGFKSAQHDDMTEVDIAYGKRLTFFRCVFDSSVWNGSPVWLADYREPDLNDFPATKALYEGSKPPCISNRKIREIFQYALDRGVPMDAGIVKELCENLAAERGIGLSRECQAKEDAESKARVDGVLKTINNYFEVALVKSENALHDAEIKAVTPSQSLLRGMYQQHLIRKAGNAILEEAGFNPDNIDHAVDAMRYVPVPGALKGANYGGDAFPEPETKDEHAKMVDFFASDCREKKK